MDDDMEAPKSNTCDVRRPGQLLVMRIRNALGDQTPKERGEVKADIAIRWLFLWHKSTPGLLRRAVGIQADGYANQLERHQLVRIYKTPSIRGGRVVMLSEDGLALAEGMFPQFIGHYDARWSSVRPQYLVHDCMVQVAVLSVMDKRRIAEIWPEHVAGIADKAGHKRADCRILFEGASLPTAIEVERTSKTPGQELDRSLLASARAVERNEVAGQIFIFLNKAVADLYNATLSKPLRLWAKNESAGKWVPTGKHWQVPAAIQDRFQWAVRPDLMRGLLP
jgi:hypothetical protein